jgi:hypothetical protein
MKYLRIIEMTESARQWYLTDADPVRLPEIAVTANGLSLLRPAYRLLDWKGISALASMKRIQENRQPDARSVPKSWHRLAKSGLDAC